MAAQRACCTPALRHVRCGIFWGSTLSCRWPCSQPRPLMLRRRAVSTAADQEAHAETFAHLDADALARLLESDERLCRKVAFALNPDAAVRITTCIAQAEDAVVAGHGVPSPTMLQMRQLCIRTAVPFVGFGFFDNMIMLMAGDAIDSTLGVAFGFSTLAAAGMGQMASDSVGITLQGVIERFSDRLGLPNPELTREQAKLSSMRWLLVVSRILGIIVGCGLGMFPLLLTSQKKPQLVGAFDDIISTSQRLELMKHIETHTLEEGASVIESGEISDFVYMVQKGRLRVIGTDFRGVPFTVCLIMPGQLFGRQYLEQPATVRVIAEHNTQVQCVSKAEFVRILGEVHENVEGDTRYEEEVYHRVTRRQTNFIAESAQGTGKTVFFANLSSAEKMQVLRCLPNWGCEMEQRLMHAFQGKKTSFFATFSGEERAHCLNAWQKLRTADGKHLTQPQAPKQGQGKTRYFAQLTQEQKLEVLHFVPDLRQDELAQFHGVRGEKKTRFFAHLTPHKKTQAINKWKEHNRTKRAERTPNAVPT